MGGWNNGNYELDRVTEDVVKEANTIVRAGRRTKLSWFDDKFADLSRLHGFSVWNLMAWNIQSTKRNRNIVLSRDEVLPGMQLTNKFHCFGL